MAADSLHDCFDPERNFATDIICNCDLSFVKKERIVHTVVVFILFIWGSAEIAASYLNSLSEQQIHDMAFTFTDGYRRGFELYRIDLSKKKTVNIRFRLGFERMVREVISQFHEMGLKPCI